MNILSILFIVFGFVVIYTANHRNPSMFLLLFLVYILRCFLAYWDVYVSGLPGTGTDTVYFDFLGNQWRITSIADIFQYIGLGSQLYGWFVSIIYSITDSDRFVAQWFNVILSILAIKYLYLTAVMLTSRKVALLIAWIFAFWPTYILFSTILLRESWVIFCLVAAVFHLVKWQVGEATKNLVYCSLYLALGMAFHSGLILGLVSLPLIIALTRKNKKRPFGSGRKGIELVFSIACLVVALSFGIGAQKFSRSTDLSASTIFERQSKSARDRTAYLSDVEGTSYLKLVAQTPLRIGYFLLKPFPWDIQIFLDLIGFVDATIFLFLCYIIYKRIRRKSIERNEYMILVLGLLITITLAAATSNYGTAVRHRAKVLPFFLLLGVPRPPKRVLVSNALSRKGKAKNDFREVERVSSQSENLSQIRTIDRQK